MDFECQPKEGVLPILVRTSSREFDFGEGFNYNKTWIAQSWRKHAWRLSSEVRLGLKLGEEPREVF